MRENFNDIYAFLLVAREGSFTRAAAQLGVSQSALSQTVRGLESRLGVRLLSRTTRSVTPTAAGERLLAKAAPRFDEIEAELAGLTELREKPAGTIRISSSYYAAENILWPKLTAFLHDYPDIRVEVNIEHRLIDIVAERYDAGVRLGDQVANDMVAVRISPANRMAVAASPAYWEGRALPQSPKELTQHQCINLRLPTLGGVLPWEFEKDGQPLTVQVEGQCMFNLSPMVLQAALAGHGVAYLPEGLIAPHVAAGRLQQVLEDWCQPGPGYHLYYPSQRLASPAFALLVDALRHRQPGALAATSL